MPKGNMAQNAKASDRANLIGTFITQFRQSFKNIDLSHHVALSGPSPKRQQKSPTTSQ